MGQSSVQADAHAPPLPSSSSIADPSSSSGRQQRLPISPTPILRRKLRRVSRLTSPVINVLATVNQSKLPQLSNQTTEPSSVAMDVRWRLNSHPHIATAETKDRSGLPILRASNCLQPYLRNEGTSMLERLMWSRDVACGLDYMHLHGVRHGNLGPHNLLLTDIRRIMICDFAGAALDHRRLVAGAKAGFRHPQDSPSSEITVRTDLHSLGSTIYEIITGKAIFEDEGYSDDAKTLMLLQNHYPPVGHLPLGAVMTGCWKCTLVSPGEAILFIDREIRTLTSRYQVSPKGHRFRSPSGASIEIGRIPD